MKRIVSLVLIAVMLLAFSACASEEVRTTEEKKEDITRLSAKELYALGCEKNGGLMNGEYETTVTVGEEAFTVRTVRIREGYDAFRYSRVTAEEELYYFEGNAFVKNASGAFTAPATARVFRELTENYTYPTGLFGEEALFEAEKDGLCVSYTVKNETVLGKFAFLLDGFAAKSLAGTAHLNEEGVITEEEITVTGDVGEEEKSVTLQTKLVRFRSAEIEIQKPENEEEYTLLGDIRLPGMLTVATEALLEKKDLQLTFVAGNTLLAGEKEYGFHREITLYQTRDENGKDLAYLTRQSLKTVPSKALESRFYQRYIKDGVQKENSYDVVTATLLSENETATLSLPWPGEAKSLIPKLSDLATLKMVEDSAGYSVTFTLTDEAKKRWTEAHLADLPEIALSAEAGEFVELEGTFLISRELCVTAASYSLEGSVTANGEKASFRGQYSMNLDATENITVPGLQVPTPTTPDMAPDDDVHC